MRGLEEQMCAEGNRSRLFDHQRQEKVFCAHGVQSDCFKADLWIAMRKLALVERHKGGKTFKPLDLLVMIACEAKTTLMAVFPLLVFRSGFKIENRDRIERKKSIWKKRARALVGFAHCHPRSDRDDATPHTAHNTQHHACRCDWYERRTMPSDARSLLRAAANERSKAVASELDPFATYSATGGLRCSACNYLAIKHESLWGAHALSKSHRANVARIREEEARRSDSQRIKEGKRKAENAADLDGERGPSSSSIHAEGIQGEAAPESKKARTNSVSATDETDVGRKSASIDPDWDLFKSQMEATEPATDQPMSDYSAGATLEAEAQLIARDQHGSHQLQTTEDAGEEKSAEELEAEERRRREQEEREEILSRLEEEQRQQDEADQR